MPSCKSCDRQLEPLRVQKKCPVCKGQKGSGKCFHLSCYDDGPRDACPESAGASVRSYCGSHPFFGGFSDRKFGDSGAVPLWEEGLSSGDSGYFGMVLTATRHGDAFDFFVLPGWRDGQDDRTTHQRAFNAYLRSRISRYQNEE